MDANTKPYKYSYFCSFFKYRFYCINFQKILRIVLTIYFDWLRSKEEQKRLAWEQLKPYLKKLEQPTELVSENVMRLG